MLLKYIFDRIVSFIGLLFLWPVLLVVAVLIKIKMPGGPVFFVQKRVGKDGELFNCHKFRTMKVASPQPSPEGKGASNWSTVSVRGIIASHRLERNSDITNFTNCLGYGMC
jgi:lipopolysaccharide/colanic/teichoic acid biosynthesis glycosyltransferase